MGLASDAMGLMGLTLLSLVYCRCDVSKAEECEIAIRQPRILGEAIGLAGLGVLFWDGLEVGMIKENDRD